MSWLNQEGGRVNTNSPSGWFIGSLPLKTDFLITEENMKPWLFPCLDALANFEAEGGIATLVEIKNNNVVII